MEPVPIKILLVEDDSDFVVILQERLSSVNDLSFSLEPAADLQTAIKRLQEGGIDLVLLDLNIQDSKGLPTLMSVQNHAKHLPIIVLTGEYDESLGLKALEQGAQDYFLKGEANSKFLIRSIRYAIERKHQERILRQAYSEISQLFALVPSILIRIDSNDSVLNWNSVAEHLLGVPHKEAVNRHLCECGAAWDYKILSEGIKQCRLQKRTLRLEDIEFTRPNGEKGILGITVNPIFEKEPFENPIGILIFGADITQRKRLEAELKERSTN